MIEDTIANAAPCVTPSSPGSASGLRVWPCMSAPATPSAIPARTPRAVLGTRRERMTMSFSVPVEAVRACQASASGTDLEPTVMLSTIATSTAASRARRTVSRLCRMPWRRGATAVALTHVLLNV